MERLRSKQSFLGSLRFGKPKERKKILASASKEDIDILSEIALNTLLGNVQLSDENRKKLKRHKKKIRDLSKKSLSVKKKKVLLVQNGGFLPLLIAPILSALGGIAVNALGSAIGL